MRRIKAAESHAGEKLDPLYVIFEQHLYNNEDSSTDRKSFLLNVVKDYLSYLRKKSIAIPRDLEASVAQELAFQVNTMLVKKIYGSLTLDEYRQGTTVKSRKRAGSRYSRLKTGTGG